MSCARLDRDEAIIVHDFGPRGFIGPVNVNLTQGLQPGGTITVVAATENDWLLNVIDESKNILFHFAARPNKNDLVFNSFINSVWGAQERPAKNPILKGVRATVTIVYEEAGYRIFINGKEEIFFKHRTKNLPSSIESVGALFYKVVYMNQMELVPL